jgi:MoaA/NifB/PqqE/SkfB family radical SAM enzyme
MGCNVLFQPVSDWGTPETPNLWIEDFDRLRAVIAELVGLLTSGSPILNAREQIEDWPRHFERRPKPAAGGSVACSVGLDTLVINPNGDVQNCGDWAALGNVRRESISRIWHDSRAQRTRALGCTKGCTENCTNQRPISQRVRGAIQLLRATKPHAAAADDSKRGA